MHGERQRAAFGSAARAALAALLVTLLVGAAGLSAAHAVHQSLHSDNSLPGHSCFVCSLAQGQVGSAEVGCILAVILLGWIATLIFPELPAASLFDHRLSPSRAPPRL